jgi:hypothetical protein
MKYQYSTMPEQSSCHKDKDLRTTQVRREREREHMENNNKAKPEYLKLNKTYPLT